jgi:peptide chain release factor 2
VIEAESATEAFWKDLERQKTLLKEKRAIEKDLDRWSRVTRETQDAQTLLELAQEEDSPGEIAEAATMIDRADALLREIELMRMFTGPNDADDAIVMIHSGAGGTESQDWAEMLLRMYQRWMERRGFSSETLDLQPGEEAGIKNATFVAKGEYAYGLLRAENGVHRLVRISPFDSNARRHTSFASVFVYPDIEQEIEIEINPDEIRVDTFRSSGAGGQHVNKTESAIRITHLPTGIVVQCQNERSQHKNKAQALRVLKARLYQLKTEEQQAKLDEFAGQKKDIGWASQIRSYVLQPYQMVKDLRTRVERGNVAAVLDGDIDEFIEAFLLAGGPTERVRDAE